LSLIHDLKHGLDKIHYKAGVFLHATDEKRFANVGSFNGGFEIAIRTTSMYDEFPTEPMLSFDLKISGT